MSAITPKATSDFRTRANRRRARPTRLEVEPLETRAMLSVAMLAAVEPYGLPEQFLLSPGGSVYYNSISNKPVFPPAWNGWVALGIGLGGREITAGTSLDTVTVRPYVDLLNSAGDVYFNAQTSSGTFGGFTPVAVGARLTQISSGTLPLYNAPFVFAINDIGDVLYTQRSLSGAWSGLSPVGLGVGAISIVAGAFKINASPLSYEPYVFMLNGANNIYFTERNTNGSWNPWSPVGVGVGADSISSIAVGNVPMITLVNGAGDVYSNQESTPGKWVGWSPVSAGGVGAIVETGTVANFTPWALMVNGAGGLYSSYGGAGAWSNWQSLGSASPPAAYAFTANPASAPFAFIIGINGDAYWNFQTSFATWYGWVNLGFAPPT